MLYLLITVAIIYLVSILLVLYLLTRYFWKCSLASIFAGMDWVSGLFIFTPILNTAVVLIGISDIIKGINTSSHQS